MTPQHDTTMTPQQWHQTWPHCDQPWPHCDQPWPHCDLTPTSLRPHSDKPRKTPTNLGKSGNSWKSWKFLKIPEIPENPGNSLKPGKCLKTRVGDWPGPIPRVGCTDRPTPPHTIPRVHHCRWACYTVHVHAVSMCLRGPGPVTRLLSVTACDPKQHFV